MAGLPPYFLRRLNWPFLRCGGMLGAFAEFERELIRERTKVGLRAAMERGSKPGRPHGMNPAQEFESLKLWATGKATKSELARKYGVHI